MRKDEADAASAAPAETDALLRAQLGRRLVVAHALADEGPSDTVQSAIQHFRAQAAAYAEVWEPPSQAPAETMEAALRHALTFDADVILIWVDWAQAEEPGEQLQTQPLPAEQRAALQMAPHTASARNALALAAQLGALDRCFVALIGGGVWRAAARALGYEDGYPANEPIATLIAALAREALAREAYRRQGSSPPCYL